MAAVIASEVKLALHAEARGAVAARGLGGGQCSACRPAATGGVSGRSQVVCAGSLREHPARLLAAQRMQGLHKWWTARCEQGRMETCSGRQGILQAQACNLNLKRSGVRAKRRQR